MNLFTKKMGIFQAILSFSILFTILFSLQLKAQTTWEFDGTPYEYQKAHFDSATNIIKNKLGIQMHTFGAPYNQIDATLIQVMSEDTSYKVLLFGQNNPPASTGIINLTRRVNIESATGVPSYSTLVTDFNDHRFQYTDYMVMQGHPYAWTTSAKQTEFRNIIDYLIDQGVKFTTPYEYYKYVTDLSIPRTNKIQVILKLDDLRATSSYFTPCFAAYDYLVTKKVKASFGVNWMTNLTQTQKDTLNYYLTKTDSAGTLLFEVWNHGLDHSMNSSSVGGNWSDPTSWASGTVPTEVEDAVIPTGVSITVDGNVSCNNLIVRGTLITKNTGATSLTVNGDVTIYSGGSFTSPALTGGTGNIIHTLNIYGDFINSGGTFDFRTGSAGSTMRVLNTAFLGNYNSTITVGTYSSSNNDFNSITVNKTDGAKVVLGSDVFIDQGASTCVSQLILTSGIVETGNYAIHVLSTTGADLIGASSTSYILGAFGRGMSNSNGKSLIFQVGDADGYRPITIKSTTGGVGSGHNCVVRCIPGNANLPGSSYNNIDAVSKKRYYKLTYNKGIGSGAASMSFNLFSPSYGIDDGVDAGNTDLRVAYSIDNMLTWNGIAQTVPHLTSLASPPTTIVPDTTASQLTLNSGTGSIYMSLAKIGLNNPLPVELTTFNASLISNKVVLNWTTATETNNSGFEIFRSVRNGEWKSIAFVSGAGNSNTIRNYKFIDAQLNSESLIQYRLKQIDNNGNALFSQIVEVNTGILINGYLLDQNYPNPFNPTTTIKFGFAKETKASLLIFDVLGNKVAELFNDIAQAGRIYDIDFNASNFASGVYYYKLSSPDQIQTKKMLLVK